MNPAATPSEFRRLLGRASRPITILAPMQDVTDREFMGLIASFGGPDLYFTEYFRVLPTSRLDKKILRSIDVNPTGRPVVAQLIGNDIPSLVRTTRELQQHAVAGIDLNLGCPAPVVYRKCAGGGLLRDPARIDRILGSIRDACDVPFSVKTRIAFENPSEFDELLRIFLQHPLDLLTVHGRTVKGGYRTAVDYARIADAASIMPCPVVANGNIHSPDQAEQVLKATGAHGLMIGRGAIRNPWLFRQIRGKIAGDISPLPSGREVLQYIEALYSSCGNEQFPEFKQVQKMKKYLNFIGLGIDASGEFLHSVRRVASRAELFAVCRGFLDHDHPMNLTPFDLSLPDSDQLAGVHT